MNKTINSRYTEHSLRLCGVKDVEEGSEGMSSFRK